MKETVYLVILTCISQKSWILVVQQLVQYHLVLPIPPKVNWADTLQK